jgi:hypothetical protein
LTPPRALARLTPALLALALAGCGSSSTSNYTQATSTPARTQTQATTQSTTGSAAAGTVTASSGAVSAALHAGTHQPKVEAPWPIRITATQNGRPAKASVIYEYLFAGQVVAHRSHYRFTGHFSDIIKWPASAVGYQLTFRAVVSSGGATVNLDYPVQVSR